MNVYEKLFKVQQQLKAPKNQYNNFGKYYYRNCEDIQEAVKPLLNEVKAILVIGDEHVFEGDRHYIRAVARFIDCESGEMIENPSSAREEESKKGMDGSQITGAASSYARKYALNGLFCIDDSKDADSAASKKELIENFKNEIERTGKSFAYFLGNACVAEVEQMSEEALLEAIKALKHYPDKKVS